MNDIKEFRELVELLLINLVNMRRIELKILWRLPRTFVKYWGALLLTNLYRAWMTHTNTRKCWTVCKHLQCNTCKCLSITMAMTCLVPTALHSHCAVVIDKPLQSRQSLPQWSSRWTNRLLEKSNRILNCQKSSSSVTNTAVSVTISTCFKSQPITIMSLNTQLIRSNQLIRYQHFWSTLTKPFWVGL